MRFLHRFILQLSLCFSSQISIHLIFNLLLIKPGFDLFAFNYCNSQFFIGTDTPNSINFLKQSNFFQNVSNLKLN